MRPFLPESFQGQVSNGGTGGEVQVLQLWAEFTEAITRAAKEKTTRVQGLCWTFLRCLM